VLDLIEGDIRDFLNKGRTLIVHTQGRQTLSQLFSSKGVTEDQGLDDGHLPATSQKGRGDIHAHGSTANNHQVFGFALV
jgi:hypothetical protein